MLGYSAGIWIYQHLAEHENTLDLAAENLTRRGGDDRERVRVTIRFCRVEKREPRQVPQPRGDLGWREIECDRQRGVILRGDWHAPAIGQMRVLFK